MIEKMKEVRHEVEFCVIGGGLAGLCAAVAAARHGVRVALMQERPVLGGNASSEIRMWVCGASGRYDRETGIIEELFLENYYQNHNLSFSIWDAVLYGTAAEEENLELFLNCTCQEAEMEGNSIRCVKGWQMTTQTYHRIYARYFADCSGDSVLAPLTGAEHTLGREAADTFGETIGKETADCRTMGMSCLIQAREYPGPQKFTPPVWAHTYATDADLPSPRDHELHASQNFWWIELGGDRDGIHETEEIKHELLRTALGIWDHIKNYGDHNAENWALDWIGFLPAKRESRRYVGDYVLTQRDVETGGKFADTIAYGGWPMDDHAPEGILYPGPPNVNHPVDAAYGIPYRCLYSRNIENLLFAGRNISVSHAALSSTRVMATCAVLGQAAGTAAAMAIRAEKGLREIPVSVLQQILMEDDCYLPGLVRKRSDLTRRAHTLYPALQDGPERKTGNCAAAAYEGALGCPVEYTWPDFEHIGEIRLVFDSELERPYDNMPCWLRLEEPDYRVPKTLVKDYRITAETPQGSVVLAEVSDNHQRLVRHRADVVAKKISLIPLETHGYDKARLFSMDVR